jgi:molybdopterin converting factor small subunit
MKITVRLSGPLVRSFGFSSRELDLPEGTLAGELPALLGASPSPPRIFTRDGQGLAPREPLRDGDKVMISPIYSGG